VNNLGLGVHSGRIVSFPAISRKILEDRLLQSLRQSRVSGIPYRRGDDLDSISTSVHKGNLDSRMRGYAD